MYKLNTDSTVQVMQADEIPKVIHMARLFAEESPEYQDWPFDVARVNSLFHDLLIPELGRVFLCYRGNLLVGALAVQRSISFFSTREVLSDIGLFVVPAFRRSGVAAQLVNAYVEWARSLPDDPAITIGTSAMVETRGAEKLYKSFGFERIGSIHRLRAG